MQCYADSHTLNQYDPLIMRETAPECSDISLAKAAQKSNLGAFNILVERYQRIAYTVAYRILANRELAEDATQNAFLSAYTSLHQFKDGNFKSWLLRIVTNECLDMLRYAARRPSASIDEMQEEPDAVPFEPVDPDELPEEQALRHELGAAIMDGFQALSPEQLTVLVLSDIEGLSYNEIVQVTGMTLNTVKVRLHRARHKMRAILLNQPQMRDVLPAHLINGKAA